MTSGDSAGWSGGSLIIGGAILLILLFGIFGGGWGGNRTANAFVAGEMAGFSGASPIYSATDRDQWMNHCDTSKQIAALSSRTDLQVASILDKISSTEAANLRDALGQERAKNIAKDTKIDMLNLQIVNNDQFRDLQAQLCALGNALSLKPNTPPFVINGGFAQPDPCNRCC